MSTLFLVPLGVITSIALGAVIVVAFSIITSVLLLPVLLRILGHRINAGRIPWRGRRRGARRRPRRGAGMRWDVIAERVMKYPLVFLGAALVLMVGVALPAKDLTTFTPDAGIVPTSSPIRQGFDRMQSRVRHRVDVADQRAGHLVDAAGHPRGLGRRGEAGAAPLRPRRRWTASTPPCPR